MGANASDMQQGANASSQQPSRILSFHSTSQWKAHFDASQETDKLMVLDFTASWCGPCKHMDPVVRELSATFTNVEFVKIDVDELMKLSIILGDITAGQGVAQEYEVQAMPTFILIRRGKVIDKVVGARKEDLHNLIHKHTKMTTLPC